MAGALPRRFDPKLSRSAAIYETDDVPARVVAEASQGSKMVKHFLHTADPNPRVKLVTSAQGKVLCGEPVAHLFEAGKVVLHGRMPELLGMRVAVMRGRGCRRIGRTRWFGA